jgi:hypothetical protein
MSAAAVLRQEDAEHARVADVLLSLANEMERTRAIGVKLEQSISGVLAADAQPDDLLRDLQQLDLMVQSLEAMHAFATQLSAEGERLGFASIDAALKTVKLSALRQRLGGGEELQGSASEVCELF